MSDTGRYRVSPYPEGQGMPPRQSADGRVAYGMGAPAARWHAGAPSIPSGYAQVPPGAAMDPALQRLYAQQLYGQMPAQQPRKRKRRIGAIIAIVVALLCIGVAAFLVLGMFGGDNPSRRSGALGQLENKTPEEIQQELDRVVQEGMFNISIASVVQFPNGSSEGELRIENVPGNRYLMSVQITLDDTGETVYESGIIEPDHHIQRDVLAVPLAKGDYDATATFTALDPQTEEEVGTAAAKVLLQVLA